MWAQLLHTGNLRPIKSFTILYLKGIHLLDPGPPLLRRRDRLGAGEGGSLVGGSPPLGSKGDRLPQLLPPDQLRWVRGRIQKPLLRPHVLAQVSRLQSGPVHCNQVTPPTLFCDKFFMLRYSRHDVIAMVEMSPKKSCEQGWKYDHSTVFTTITSEVNLLSILLTSKYSIYENTILYRTTGCARMTSSRC